MKKLLVGLLLSLSCLTSFAQDTSHMVDKDLNVEFYAQSEKNAYGASTGKWNIVFLNNDSTGINIRGIQSVRIKRMDASIFSNTLFPKGEITLRDKPLMNFTVIPSNGQLVFQYDLSQYFNKNLKLPRSIYQQKLEIELVLIVQANKNQILNKNLTYILPLDVDTRRMAY